jgi:hypothetical protein
MTADGWRGACSWSRTAIAGGLLAVSLLGVALGIGLTQPPSRSPQRLPGGISARSPVAGCHMSRSDRNEWICIGAGQHIGGGLSAAQILATRAAIIKAFHNPRGHGTGLVTITATRIPRR